MNLRFKLLLSAATGFALLQVTFAAEEIRCALALRKSEAVVEDEFFVVKEVEHCRQIVRRAQPRVLASARIEVPVAAVEWQRK